MEICDKKDIRIAILTDIYFCILAFAIVFGLIAYNYIDVNIGFSYIDELLALALFVFYILKVLVFKKLSKEFIFCLVVFLFYLGYSMVLSINVFPALTMDFLIQIKPFICFYTIYSLPIELTLRQKTVIKLLCIAMAILLMTFCLMGQSFVLHVMSHYSRVATAATILGILYFHCSKQTKQDIVVMLAIISIGLLSTRYKFYAFYITFIIFLFLYTIKGEFKISLKVMLIALLTAIIVTIALYDKIEAYTVTGADEDNLWSRTALYINTPTVLNSYFPFGSGFATYGTWASGVYYSPLYIEYNMSNIDGLTIDKHDYVADTYFPALVQFGYIGVIFFLWFWKRIYQRAKLLLATTKNIYDFKIILLILLFFLIESIADSTFTSNRGVVMMMILASYLNANKYNLNNENITNRRISLQ